MRCSDESMLLPVLAEAGYTISLPLLNNQLFVGANRKIQLSTDSGIRNSTARRIAERNSGRAILYLFNTLVWPSSENQSLSSFVFQQLCGQSTWRELPVLEVTADERHILSGILGLCFTNCWEVFLFECDAFEVWHLSNDEYLTFSGLDNTSADELFADL